MKAAILVKSGMHLTFDEVTLSEELLPGQVLVNIEHSGICCAQINEISVVVLFDWS